jgi:filamentous hemagglutinin
MSSWPPTIGQCLPRAQDAHGVESKLRAYSLNPEHEIGAHKARVFRRALGVGLDDIDYLVDQVLVGIGETPISDVRDNAPHGILCEVVIAVLGIGVAAGRPVLVTTSWEYRSPEDAPRLVSAYVES